jgi:hypothetical protein
MATHVAASQEPLARPPLHGDRSRAALAFARALRDESIRFLEVHPWANPTEEMLEDDGVLQSRSRVARRALREAADASLEAVLGGRAESGLARTGGHSALSLDTTPAWSMRRRAGDSTVRLDVPLAPGALRLRWSRGQHAGPKMPQRMGTHLAMDPFDESVRVVMPLGW